jgi:hypothetical protein
MKNRSLLKILSGVLVAGLMVSCGKMESDADSSAPDLNTGADNYVDLAVTGGVASTSYTCAEIIGYANLGPLALAIVTVRTGELLTRRACLIQKTTQPMWPWEGNGECLLMQSSMN